MKYLVISDVHLGKKFEPRKFEFLKTIVAACDRVVLNGDFWEGETSKFSDFLSAWRPLFPLLKQKDAYYVYGNHDPKKLSDERVNLFSTGQGERFEIKSGDKLFIIRHGNPLSFDIFLEKLPLPHFLEPLMVLFGDFVVKYFGPDFYKKFVLQLIHKKYNKELKERILKEYAPNKYFVFGHTHYREYDEKTHMINAGLIKHGIGQYLIIENGNFEMKEELY